MDGKTIGLAIGGNKVSDVKAAVERNMISTTRYASYARIVGGDEW